MKILIFLCTILTKVHLAFAYIPSIPFVLNKSVETTGRQIVAIDQDVVFKVGDQQVTIQESWLIEGDKNLKLSAQLKAPSPEMNINFQALYNNFRRITYQGKTKLTQDVSSDFYQKFLFIRSIDSFKNLLSRAGVAPDLIRLSRADGRVAFALGAQDGQPSSPQIWIDQEDFALRKIRFASGSVIKLADFAPAAGDKNFLVGRTQKISWNGADVLIKVKSISLKPQLNITTFYPQNFSTPSEMSFTNSQAPFSQLIESFYKRFR